jgi:hypothetical protein
MRRTPELKSVGSGEKIEVESPGVKTPKVELEVRRGSESEQGVIYVINVEKAKINGFM